MAIRWVFLVLFSSALLADVDLVAAEVKATATPKSIPLLRTGEALQGVVVEGGLRVSVPRQARSKLPDVVEVTW